ncbi:CpsD/CapB family tyrosine-protein kinase [Bacillus sp. 31A1R]|uniref:non-specific protein-tyrosine kinase n=1 Tax=Robertmurraya mangrovi TaxID=3098077 RepID=A0ABU5J1M5_9BACI|nr:CpsD/CapB family tyrosine-protein kinase [Bacillus sp. 31A1R]MDZ5473322.1 CpsD/CapB family tyrosine-protein kinase [Bacillus sp. 31A1R]
MYERRHKEKLGVNLIAHYHPKSLISEQYRLIRTNIQFSSVQKKIKTIMVTSSEPADGKSTTATNLAIVLAQQGTQVLLVDTDLRKPTLHYAFNISNLNGLTNVLTKNSSLEDTIIKTHIPKLDILTSGPVPPNPSELLNSEPMQSLIRQIEKMYEYIVFDTPPVLAVSDPQILANKCDGIVMVVGSGKTRKERAKKAKELLEKAQSHILGVVMNGVNSKKGEYYSQYK